MSDWNGNGEGEGEGQESERKGKERIVFERYPGFVSGFFTCGVAYLATSVDRMGWRGGGRLQRGSNTTIPSIIYLLRLRMIVMAISTVCLVMVLCCAVLCCAGVMKDWFSPFSTQLP